MAAASHKTKEETSSAVTLNSVPPRVRSNLALLTPLRFYIPDDDDCVPYVFALSRRTISTAWDSEMDLLTGYLSALCAVLPDVADVASKSMAEVGYQLQEIKIPSQAEEMGIDISSPSDDLRAEIMNFAQVCYLPFQPNPPDSMIDDWLRYRLPASVGCGHSALRLFSSSHVAILQTVFNVCTELRSCIASQVQSTATTSTTLGQALMEVSSLISRCHWA